MKKFFRKGKRGFEKTRKNEKKQASGGGKTGKRKKGVEMGAKKKTSESGWGPVTWRVKARQASGLSKGTAKVVDGERRPNANPKKSCPKGAKKGRVWRKKKRSGTNGRGKAQVRSESGRNEIP